MKYFPDTEEKIKMFATLVKWLIVIIIILLSGIGVLIYYLVA